MGRDGIKLRPYFGGRAFALRSKHFGIIVHREEDIAIEVKLGQLHAGFFG